MQNKGWLRYSLASLMVVGAGLGGFLIACGDDDDVVAPKDGGGTDTGPTGNDAGTDTGPPAKADAGTPARLQLVNAATDLGPSDVSGGLRVCFGAGADVNNTTLTPLPALPEESSIPGVPPAIYIGLGGNVTGTGLDLTKLAVQPYLMNAQTLFAKGVVKPGPGAPSTSCAELFAPDGGAGLVENKDYWKLPAIPPGTFLVDKSYLLVLTGCTEDSAIANKEKCGPGFANDGGPGVGNLQVRIFELDRATAIDAAKAGTQFIHASAPAKVFLAVAAGGAPVVPGYTNIPGDAGTFKPVSGGTPVDLYAKSALTQVDGVNFASDFFTANPAIPALAIPLQSIQRLSYPTGVPDGGAYANGAAWTFLAVGDPTEDSDAGGRFNTKKFHYLAFPNSPPISVYKP